MKMMEFFTCQDWNFHCENMVALLATLSPEDKLKFDFDVRKIEWSSYLEKYCLGVRRFVLNEDPSSLPNSKSNLIR